MSKRQRMDQDDQQQNSGTSESHGSEIISRKLLGRKYYNCTFTIRRRNHLTINGYKPGDNSDPFKITLLPASLFDFWVTKDAAGWAQPFKDLSTPWPYCLFHNATITLSHFIPLQKGLTPSQGTIVDTTSFNIAPYMYIVEEDRGLMPWVTVTPNVTRTDCYNQQVKLPSTFYWESERNDEGLLGCNNVRTLSAGETYTKKYNFENHPFYFYKMPQYSASGLTYLPFTHEMYDGGNAVSTIPQNKRIWSDEELQRVGLLGDINKTNTINPIFLFLPFIEPISSSEDVARLMGHVLLETEITLTAYSFADSYGQILSSGDDEYVKSANRIPLLVHPLDGSETRLYYSNYTR